MLLPGECAANVNGNKSKSINHVGTFHGIFVLRRGISNKISAFTYAKVGAK
jgi:hypothetical protein